ncbi:hypothetical protein [Paenibacillus terrae]
MRRGEAASIQLLMFRVDYTPFIRLAEYGEAGAALRLAIHAGIDSYGNRGAEAAQHGARGRHWRQAQPEDIQMIGEMLRMRRREHQAGKIGKKHLEPALGVFSIELPSKAYARYISTQSKAPFVHCYIL